MKRVIFSLLLAFSLAVHADPFVPGQVLTANGLNSALNVKANTTDLAGTSSGQGAAAIGYKLTGTGTVARTVANKFTDVRSVTDYGVKCDGSTNDYSGFIAAYNDVPAGALLTVPSGTCMFGTAPVFGTKRVSWRGAGGRQTIWRYNGASTTTDVFTFGTSAGELNGVRIEGIGFASSTSMTAGAGVHIYNLTRSALRDLYFDHQDGDGNFYHAVWFDGVDFATLDVFQARAKQDAVRVNGNGPKADLFLTNGKIASSMVGLHIGGNFGGFQIDKTDIINNATNVLIDKTIVASNNRETFFGPGTMIDTADTTRTATTYNGIGVDIQDTGGFIFFDGTWNATAGTLVRIGSAYAGTVKFDNGFMFNAFTAYGGNGRAIDNASTSAEVVINGVRFANVQGAGLYSSVATSSFVLNNPLFNTDVTAPISSNIATTNRWTYQSGNQSVIGKMAIGSQVQYPSGVSGTPDITAAGANLNLTYWGADASNYWLSLGHSKSGTKGTQTTVGVNDQLGGISFEGSDGTAFRSSVQILGVAAGSPSGGQLPGELHFRTNNGTSTGDRVIIEQAGVFRPAGDNLYSNGSATNRWSNLYAKNGNFSYIAADATLQTYRGIQSGTALTGGTNAIGIFANNTFNSDVTSLGRGFATSLSTQAAAFTLANLIHYEATGGTIGAGSTVTTQAGFSAASTLVGATNNYGFYSNLASATGAWNFYANGTASNYFNGTTYIGTQTAVAGEKLAVNGRVLGTSSNSALTAYNASGQTSVMLFVGDGVADQKKTELLATTAGGFTIRAIDDAYSTSSSVISATRGAGVAWSSITMNGGKFAMDSAGNALVKATGGLGYGAGAGGAVTQLTSKVTGVTLNTPTGQITMNGAALAAAATACFTLTNSTIAATDVVNTNIASGATSGAYTLQVEAVAAGSARMCLNNRSGGSLSEAAVINFAVIKGSIN